VCKGVLLSNLCKRSITNAVKEEAKAKYDAMLAANMKPRSTTGMWVDDAGEWLVIYAGQHLDGEKIHHDGFEV
jgi:uncharacterized cupin superfamily protein